FGFVTASFIREKETRERMTRYCAWWAALPLAAAAALSVWYIKALPGEPLAMVMGRSPEMAPLIRVFVWLTPVLLAGAALMAVRSPRGVKKVLALLLLAAGLLYMGSFEWIREAARRPWLIPGHTWSTSIRADQAPAIREQGFLKSARWVSREEISRDDALEAGREIFRIQCLCCHSAGGPMNDILPLTEKYSAAGMDAQLTGQGKLNLYMPRFMGAPEERRALARFIVEGLHGKKEAPAAVELEELPFETPPFDEENDEYVLLAWSGPGMHGLSDRASWWVLKEPGVDIGAQLIKRGETPEIVTDDVILAHEIAPGFEYPSKSLEYWKHSETVAGRKIPPDTGAAGSGLKGEMIFNDERMAYTKEKVPAAPYAADGSFNPYPLFTIIAMSGENREVLARTRIAALTSTEMGCRNCHGGAWRVHDRAGLAPATCRDVLAVHDRISKTTLLRDAENGAPARCGACHADARDGTTGDPDLLNLSAAIHGFHANYLTDRDGDACNSCHPSSPEGATRGFRGIHAEMGMDCTSCHGKLEDL
ncbi:MAG: cytochrome C, partial [Desulfobacterales bacterium]|nr:cytochrome C [Desulfobacterales bacterium]